MGRRSEASPFVTNEKLFLIGGMELKLRGKDRFWSREMLDTMDEFRVDGKRTGGGTFLRAAETLIDSNLVVSHRPEVLASHQRIYYSMTEEGLYLAPFLYIQRVTDVSEDLESIKESMRSSLIGKFVLHALTQEQIEP